MAMPKIEVRPRVGGPHTDSCAVYEVKTGAIVHIHETLTLPGACRPTEADLMAEAVSHASRITGKLASQLASLRIVRHQMKAERGCRYRVDLKHLKLIEERIASRPSTGRPGRGSR